MHDIRTGMNCVPIIMYRNPEADVQSREMTEPAIFGAYRAKTKRFRVPLTAAGLFLIYFLVYPHRIELSGDQTAQVVAAESLLRENGYKVSLHEAYGPEVVVNIGADLRQPLRWFPPGYSIALYALARLGLNLAMSATVLFYLAKFIWTLFWMSASLAYDIPYPLATGAVAFALFLTYPSTTTEIFESMTVALLFLALSGRLKPAAATTLASASIAGGTFFRFAAVKLLAFYALVEWVHRPRLATLFKVASAAVPSLIVYAVCTRVIGGDSTPYHGVGPAPHTRWSLLAKGIYYAVTGGWSAPSAPLRVLIAAVVLAALAGLVRLARNGSLPRWLVVLLGFQAYTTVFLIFTQIWFGGMYPEIQPAFAVPRFYALAQPWNVAALLFLAPFCLPFPRSALRYASAAVLLVCMVETGMQNRLIMAGMTGGADGFLRFADVAALHRALRSENADGVFDGAGVFVYTAADPRIVYPDNVRGLRSPNQARIAVVRFAGRPDDLLDALETKVSPYKVLQFDRFEVDFFTLPRGFELRMNPRPGSILRWGGPLS